MFIGHFAAGFAAKRLAPRVSLGTLFAAVQLPDLLWPLCLLLGVETVRIDPGNTAVTPLDFVAYPYTHSLTGVVLLGALFAGGHWMLRRDVRAATILAAGVVSHWVLDFLTHRPDLPLTFDGTEKFGLGLWNSVAGTVLVETAMFAAGVALYAGASGGKGAAAGWWKLAALVALLAGIYAANLLGPPPPDPGMIAVAGNATWLFVVAAWWVDRGRRAGPAPQS